MGKIDYLSKQIIDVLDNKAFRDFKPDHINKGLFIRFKDNGYNMIFTVDDEFFYYNIQKLINNNPLKELKNFAKFIKNEFNISTELNSCKIKFQGYSPIVEFRDIK